MKIQTKSTLIAVIVSLFVTLSAQEVLKPYILGSISTETFEETSEKVVDLLTNNGFEIVGKYIPYENAKVLIITNDELQTIASKSTYGGYGAVQRVSITKVRENIQISYTNPKYFANAYRLQNNLETIVENLKLALGYKNEFGSVKGLSRDKLKNYHYTVMMPYFDDQTVLAKYKSHSEAVKSLESGFSKNSGSVEKLYKVQIPGKDEVVYGVAIKEGSGSDKRIIENCDKEDLKHTCYMPYEILVLNNKIYAMQGKFRIALNFPDLSMGTFMKISTAPGAIEKALKKVAKNK